MECSFDNFLFSFSVNSDIHICSRWVSTDILFIMGHVFLPFCMSVNLCLDARHCKFYFFRCSMILYSYKSWAWFRDAVTWKQFKHFISCFYDLLGSSGEMFILGIIVSNNYMVYPVPHELRFFLVWQVAQALFLDPCEHKAIFPLVLRPMNSHCLGLCGPSSWSPQIRESAGLHNGFLSLSVLQTGDFFKTVSRAHFVCFASLSDHFLSLLDV